MDNNEAATDATDAQSAEKDACPRCAGTGKQPGKDIACGVCEARRSAGNGLPASDEAWGFEGGDGHGYRYQYLGPIHYLCECGDHFLNRDRWIAHKAVAAISARLEDYLTGLPCYGRRGEEMMVDVSRDGLIADLRQIVDPQSRTSRTRPIPPGGSNV